MNIVRWGVSAVAALLFTSGAVLAEDASELAEMKNSMESMKAEMESLRAADAAMDAEKSHAGGAPESLRSRSGKACLKINGRIRTRYRATWGDTDADPDHRRYRDRFGVESSQLGFTADFTENTTAFIQMRLEAASDSQGGIGEGDHGFSGFIDEAWWQWRNICGSGVTLRLGKILLPFGEQYAGVMPYVSYNDNDANYNIYNIAGNGPGSRIWTPGAVYGVGPELSYSMGDFTLTAAVFDGNINSYGEGGGWAAGNTDPQYSAWINTAVKLDYDPSVLEGLHVSASFLGVHNFGANSVDTGNGDDSHVNYSPYFNLAADYTHGSFNFFVENTMGINAGMLRNRTRNAGRGTTMYGQTFVNTLTAGVTYNYSQKLAFTGMFDWGNISSQTLGHSNDFRAGLGGQYDFNNGIVLQASYSHIWSMYAAENDVRHMDEIHMRTIVEF